MDRKDKQNLWQNFKKSVEGNTTYHLVETHIKISTNPQTEERGLFACLFVFVFYGISTFFGYLMPNPFLYK